MNKEINTKWEKIKKLCHVKKIEMIDFKTQDIDGKLHHITIPIEEFNDTVLEKGVAFNATSMGFKGVGDYSLVQIPDLDTVFYDIFRKRPTLSFFVDIYKTGKERKRFFQDSRFVAQKAEKYLKSTGTADTLNFASEIEFYLFKNAKFDARRSSAYYNLESDEKMHGSGYHAVNPMDLYDDFRDDAATIMKDFGIKVKYHHHELGKKGQQEIELGAEQLMVAADQLVTSKYLLFNLADISDVKLTFMPKPMFNAPGNAWHLHPRLIKDGVNLFYDKKADGSLSKIAEYFSAGILKNIKTLMAFTNPSTNSYRRIVPGFEAPILQSYGKNSVLNSLKIPTYINDPKDAFVELRFPDMMANPYIAMSAVLMAGLDGIESKLELKDIAGDAVNNLKSMTELTRDVKKLPRYLEEVLTALQKDSAYLQKGDVFTEKLIDYWGKIKQKEICAIYGRPHPYEFKQSFYS